MKTRIYYADTSSLADGDLFNYHYDRVPEYRQAKVEKMKFERDKRLSLGVGVLLEQAMRDFGIKSDVAVGEHGKPYFTDAPDVHFSLSHSEERVMCAISDVPVGCDTELTDKCDPHLSERFFAEEEKCFIGAQTDEETKKLAFCRLWTLKESYVKMLGTGMTLPFSDFSVSIGEPTSVKCEKYGTECSFYEFETGDGYCVSVCESKKNGITPEFIKVDLTVRGDKMSHIDILEGKKWWACGDSFTEWSPEVYEPGELENYDGEVYFKAYPYFIAKRNPGLTVYNAGRSGRTMAYPPEHDYDNAFANEMYKNIPDDVDYITLYFGINDSHHRPCYRGQKPGIIELGTIDDQTTDTFYGAWNVVLEYLIEHHPYAHIGIIISNDCETLEYPEAEVRLARKWGIPYLDLNGGYNVPLMQHVTGKPEVCERAIELRRNAFYTDPVNNNPHTNTKAQEYQSAFIETWLRTL